MKARFDRSCPSSKTTSALGCRTWETAHASAVAMTLKGSCPSWRGTSLSEGAASLGHPTASSLGLHATSLRWLLRCYYLAATIKTLNENIASKMSTVNGVGKAVYTTSFTVLKHKLKGQGIWSVINKGQLNLIRNVLGEKKSQSPGLLFQLWGLRQVSLCFPILIYKIWRLC